MGINLMGYKKIQIGFFILIIIFSKLCLCQDVISNPSEIFINDCDLVNTNKQNIRIKTSDDFYVTPLIYAVNNKKLGCVKKVYHRFSGINQVDDSGSTALIYAELQEKRDVVNFLIENGADKNIKNQLGFSFMDVLISNNFANDIMNSCDEKTLKPYLEYKNHIIHPVAKLSPMYLATSQNNLNCVKTVYSLFGRINLKNEYGYTPLMKAAAFGNKEIMRYLISKGAYETIQNNKGNTYKDIYKIVKKEDYNYKEDIKNLGE